MTTTDVRESSHEPPHPDHGPDVIIDVNGVKLSIHRGHQTVVQIKTIAGVNLAEVLEQIIGGQLTPLPDDGAVTIKGGEQFVSHVRSGAGS